jgi:hypothetical protein
MEHCLVSEHQRLVDDRFLIREQQRVQSSDIQICEKVLIAVGSCSWMHGFDGFIECLL